MASSISASRQRLGRQVERLTPLAISVTIWAVIAIATVAALDFRRDARLAPLVIGAIALFVSSIDIFRSARGLWQSREQAGPVQTDETTAAIARQQAKLKEKIGATDTESDTDDAEVQLPAPESPQEHHSAFAPFAWLTYFTVLYVLLGAVIATLLFGLLFLRVQSRSSWWVIAVVTVPSALGLSVIITALGLPEHEGFLRSLILTWLGG